MSGITGKKNSTLKKESIKESKLLSTGVKAIKFWHEATAGETSIPFGSLNLPSVILSNGLTNPSSTEILAANLALFHTNVDVFSSLNQKLMEGLSYVVKNSQIKFVNGYVATEGEIFEVAYKNDVITGTNVVDARPLTATGTLIAGNTEFPVGEAFKTNQYPTTQLGEVLVFVEGVCQFRNVGNATAAPAADGNYQEVASIGGFGSIIKFNDVFATDVSVQVISRNLIAERPDISMMQLIESLGGQLDAVLSTVAALAGVPVTNFQVAPNQVDLKAFGDIIYQIRKDLDVVISKQPIFYEIINTGDTLLDRFGEIRFDLAGEVKTGDVDSVMVTQDDVANTRTRFNFSQNCYVDIGVFSRIATLGRAWEVMKNGNVEFSGTTPRTSTDISQLSAPIRINAGDYLTLTVGFLGDHGGEVLIGLAPVIVHMKITKR